jgi:hypothetical protein
MSNRGKKLQSEIGIFLKQYQRKAHAGWDPNDRGYDRDIEKKIKSMSPEELSALMAEELESEVPREIEERWTFGEAIQDIKFSINEVVSVALGRHADKVGTVIALLRLTPEPEYLVEVETGEGAIKVFQSKLLKI